MGAEHDVRGSSMPPLGSDDKSVPATHEARVLVVGKGVALTANVTSCEDVIVEGFFQGNIKAKNFVLAEGAQMEGEVRCAEARVGGKMKGKIVTSKNLMIGSRAIVTGELAYDSLQIADGGRLQGKMMHISSEQEKRTSPPSPLPHDDEDVVEEVKMALEQEDP